MREEVEELAICDIITATCQYRTVSRSSQQVGGLQVIAPCSLKLSSYLVGTGLEPIEKGGHKRGYPHSHLIWGQVNLEKTKITIKTMNISPN